MLLNMFYPKDHEFKYDLESEIMFGKKDIKDKL